DARLFAHAVRNHWRIENKLHWRLDVVFREDDNRIRKGNAPAILATIHHIFLNLFQKEPSKISTKKKMNRAAWSDGYRVKLLFGN
ncbi:MAG: ISAs1 family transposase, partial [Methylococcales bacterium]|nr:ISAs1 family transposase [Methylococcales bacterium]